MGFLNFGRRSETYLVVVTNEGAGKLRLNGVRTRDKGSKRDVIAHERTVCWIEFGSDGVRVDHGTGRAADGAGSGVAALLLRDVTATPTCRGVLERLRGGQSSVSKWLELERKAPRVGPSHVAPSESGPAPYPPVAAVPAPPGG